MNLLFLVAQGFVDDHLEVGLVAEAALGGLDAGFGYVFWVQIDADKGKDCAVRIEMALCYCFFEFERQFFFVSFPPLRFFIFGHEFRNYQIGHKSFIGEMNTFMRKFLHQIKLKLERSHGFQKLFIQ